MRICMFNMQSDTTLTGEKQRCSGISAMVCGVYGVDAPWVWHLDRVVRKYGRESFNNPEWVKAFIEEYIKLLNKWEKEIFDTTGENLGLKLRVS